MRHSHSFFKKKNGQMPKKPFTKMSPKLGHLTKIPFAYDSAQRQVPPFSFLFFFVKFSFSQF